MATTRRRTDRALYKERDMPDLETRREMARGMVDDMLAVDERTAMIILNNPKSWPLKKE